MVSADWSRSERDRSTVPSRLTIARLGPGLRPEVKKTADYYQFYLVSAGNKPRLVKVDPKGKVLEDTYRRVRRYESRPPMGRSQGYTAQ